jgi:hypothetical protein
MDYTVGIWDYFYLGSSVKYKNVCKYVNISIDDKMLKPVQYDQIPPKIDMKSGSVRLCIISDTHDRHHLLENLPNCDILIHCGDIFMHSSLYSQAAALRKLKKFSNWLAAQPATHKIVVAGNHDQLLMVLGMERVQSELSNAIYLCNSSVSLFGLRFWGSPISRGKSNNAAFQSEEFVHSTLEALKQHNSPIDILITHGPCHDICRAAEPRKFHIFGHVHALHGLHSYSNGYEDINGATQNQWISISAPIMSHRYDPIQLPIIVDVDVDSVEDS